VLALSSCYKLAVDRRQKHWVVPTRAGLPAHDWQS